MPRFFISDIVKTIALGAYAVAMGRMYCYALSADATASAALWRPSVK